MKKRYLTALCLAVNFLGFSQAPQVTVDFEGTSPLTSLPAGITSVDPQDYDVVGEVSQTTSVSDSIFVFVAANRPHFIEEGGDLIAVSSSQRRGQFNNVVKSVDGNNLLQTDYTGHVIIDETALGTGSYSVRLNLAVFGHSMGSTDCGIFTITGNDNGTYKDDRITARNGSFTTGLGVTGQNAFAYNTDIAPYREIVFVYNDTDKLYRVYIEGVETLLSAEPQTSGDWTDRKFYIGFSGRSSIGAAGGDITQAIYGTPNTSHLDPTTGVFTKNGVRTSDGRAADVQMRMDNIEVYQTALSADNVSTLFSGGSLSSKVLKADGGISYYPNPVEDVLYFSSNDVSSVEVYNTLGVKILSQNVNSSLDMSNLSSGVYLVKAFESDNNFSTIKVVKK